MKAKILVVKGNYTDDAAVADVITYVAESLFAAYDEIAANDVDISSTDSMIESFNRVQMQAGMTGDKRLLHLLFTAPVSKKCYPVLSNAANLTTEYFHRLGFQCIAVPHYGSEGNYMNFHYHVIINPISYLDGHRFYGRKTEFTIFRSYLEQYTGVKWSLVFKCSPNYRHNLLKTITPADSLAGAIILHSICNSHSHLFSSSK